MREFLGKTVGIDADQIAVLDGCGLSRYNLISPEQITTLLLWMQNQFSLLP